LAHNGVADRDAGISFEDLLTFWTGAASVPPIGFDKMPTLDFFTRIQGERRFPTASTCGLVLFLPRGVVDSDELLELLVFGVQNTAGFGKI
jgi:HECT-domain (ubiquitin-transferase)